METQQLASPDPRCLGEAVLAKQPDTSVDAIFDAGFMSRGEKIRNKKTLLSVEMNLSGVPQMKREIHQGYRAALEALTVPLASRQQRPGYAAAGTTRPMAVVGAAKATPESLSTAAPVAGTVPPAPTTVSCGTGASAPQLRPMMSMEAASLTYESHTAVEEMMMTTTTTGPSPAMMTRLSRRATPPPKSLMIDIESNQVIKSLAIADAKHALALPMTRTQHCSYDDTNNLAPVDTPPLRQPAAGVDADGMRLSPRHNSVPGRADDGTVGSSIVSFTTDSPVACGNETIKADTRVAVCTETCCAVAQGAAVHGDAPTPSIDAAAPRAAVPRATSIAATASSAAWRGWDWALERISQGGWWMPGAETVPLTPDVVDETDPQRLEPLSDLERLPVGDLTRKDCMITDLDTGKRYWYWQSDRIIERCLNPSYLHDPVDFASVCCAVPNTLQDDESAPLLSRA